MSTRTPRMEPRTAPITTPVFGELVGSEGVRVTCAVWVGVETAVVVRNVVGAESDVTAVAAPSGIVVVYVVDSCVTESVI